MFYAHLRKKNGKIITIMEDNSKSDLEYNLIQVWIRSVDRFINYWVDQIPVHSQKKKYKDLD